MYKATTIAYAFVQKGIEENKPVTQMKLQKLLYFAEGVHYARGYGSLIIDTIEAWKYGPVIPAVYQDYKLYGSEPIADTSFLALMNPSVMDEVLFIDDRAKETINITWDLLKDADALRLSAWTHNPGSPWAHNYKGEHMQHTPIPKQEIGSYFKALFPNV